MEISAQTFDDILADEFYQKEMKPWNPMMRGSGSMTDETAWIYRLDEEQEFIHSYFELEELIFKLKNAYFQSEKTNSN
jgi:hypothetical protein